MLDRLVGADRTPAAGSRADRLLATLTDREREVAEVVAQGLSNAQISSALMTSPATVKTHLGRGFDKLEVDELEVDNRVQVALRMRHVPHR